MHILKGRLMTYLSLILLAVVFVGMVLIVVTSSHFATDIDSQKSVIIEGSCSVDSKPPQQTAEGVMLHEDFNEAVIEGKLSKPIGAEDKLIISAMDVWFVLESDGEVIATNRRDSVEQKAKTPGYSILYIDGKTIADSKKLSLSVSYPYHVFSSKNFSDFIDMYIGDEATVYELLFQHKTLTILFCILLCFFGLFAFPIAGIVLGKIDFRYLSFAVMCFFAGLFILSQSLSGYTPLWIRNPVTCMALCTATNYLLAISALVFIKVSLEHRIHKIIGNTLIAVYALLVIGCITLHLTGISDMYTTKPFSLLFAVVFAVVLTVCHLREVSGNKEALLVSAAWLPIVIGLLLDTVNEFVAFSTLPIFEIGVSLTLINQIVILIIDLRRRYKESIRYQQMQKELYEAKVSLMVSQIQPHFLYNSLTSIAMMCTKDPKVARDATINFADYLRGNMNSLKEKNPVPFERELEHLKKYLMLEKMRFGDMLRIEYDIKTKDFSIPQLSVQPLVENAVKHGVGMKEDGGTVTIATDETEESYRVIISDDGVGFDTQAPKKDDGRSHVGMENVRQRLKEMMGAEVVIESTIGVGTKATIIIPKKELPV